MTSPRKNTAHATANLPGKTDSLRAAKQAIRREVRAGIVALAPAERAAQEARLREALHAYASQRLRLRPGLILAYQPLPDEPELAPLLAEWRREGLLCLPRMREDGGLDLLQVSATADKLVTGPYGVQEPEAHGRVVEAAALTLAVIPGRAFTTAGDRLGRGKGYYDRLLATFDALSPQADGEPFKRIATVALALRCQMYASLPSEPHDRPVDHILTA